MALTATPDTSTAAQPDPATARVTGLLYLGLGISGMLGFLVIRPQLFDQDDPAGTLTQLLEHETLARTGIALELAIVVTQVLAALWFYRLFRPVDPFAAGATAVFGTVNAVAILGSAAFLATALDAALDPVGEDTSQLMYLISENIWGVGNVFFGLWLIPMGLAALRSGWTPRPLGWILVAGGVGYLLSVFVTYLAPSAGPIAELLVVPATVGEFWMIGWLLLRGLRRLT
ncbi:DUF4386 domain-containing protein [Streptomyces sp. MNU76]|uniref:DUF4386 domain-containing protein n=1 Tax=Streptomyces sp. MNU76 TaxID=2560026 RepID=UPI001E3C8C6D|nr:DUF4386 domain-containing protein [Streptomyces sp. MNU76]MCC9704083.1 DUF4386 domain-containing protein [Streptomyces sp. MNU76]MCC9707501.1 DUF4386 domain-containing protein [Streptomyces sp. MNU76]MCC9710603.1 DUF4386 domain-containing protein [Streptomyces sp. MNU76]